MSSENIKSLEECPALDHRQPIFYFDFAPILARSVSLSQNPERVQIMCEQCVRRLAPGDIVLPQPSGFFLLVQSCAGISAEALAHEINIALLELFFGTEALKGLGTICRRATLTEINEKGLSVSLPANAPRTCSEPPKELPVEDPLKRLADSGVPGYDNLSTAFLPLINLKSNCASVFLCGALRQATGGALFGPAALAGTPAQDRASLDEALLEYSNQFARHVIPTRSATAIATSVSYETLASPRGRRLYQQALRSLGVANNPFLLVKIENVPAGIHAARCAEIVSLVRPFVRHVFVELQNDSAELLAGANLGAAGLVAALPADISLNGAGRAISGITQLARSQQSIACVLNLNGPNHFALAKSAGVRFAAQRAQSPNGYLAHPNMDMGAMVMAA